MSSLCFHTIIILLLHYFALSKRNTFRQCHILISLRHSPLDFFKGRIWEFGNHCGIDACCSPDRGLCSCGTVSCCRRKCWSGLFTAVESELGATSEASPLLDEESAEDQPVVRTRIIPNTKRCQISSTQTFHSNCTTLTIVLRLWVSVGVNWPVRWNLYRAKLKTRIQESEGKQQSFQVETLQM